MNAAVLMASVPAPAQTPYDLNAQSPQATTAPANLATVYDQAYFSRYAPRTALDIVQRIPGFTLDLGNSAAASGVDLRGFAATAGNVIVDGQRPSTKSETLDNVLSSIPASRVVRVEVGPGDLYGADYAGKSQVANVILNDGGSGVTGNVTVAAERRYTGVITPTVSASVSFRRGHSAFNIAVDTARSDQTEEGFDRVIDLSTNGQLEFRRKINSTRDYSPSISAAWSLEKSAAQSAHLNARYHSDHFVLHQTSHVISAGAPARDDALIEDYPTKTLEIGGDITRPMAGGAIKLVALASRERRNTLDESDIGDLGPTKVVGGSRQLSMSERDESLGRVTWSKSKFAGFNFETGAEIAWNALRDDLELFQFDANGNKSRVDLPIDNARVTELRGELWVNGSRSLSKSLRIDLGLNDELSDLKVRGDTTAGRKLKFLKPSMTLDWAPGDRWQMQLILRRTVAQLDFFDFISAADLTINQISGGNANLQPQRSWEGRLSVEHPLPGEGKARLELGYNLISMLQDRVLTSQGFDAPGNIGTGRQIYADLTLDAPLEKLWKGLRVKLHGNVQRTKVRDPISGRPRGFSGMFPDWQWDADIRRDVGRFAYGIMMMGYGHTTTFGTSIIDSHFYPPVSNTDVFVEFRPDPGRTLRLSLSNVSDNGAIRDLLIFLPNRDSGAASQLDRRFRNSHARIAITLKQSLGGPPPHHAPPGPPASVDRSVTDREES